MIITTSFLKLCKLKNKTKIIQGSKGAGKTYSILLRWVLMALKSSKRQHCSIVSATLPQLRTGAIKDFETICNELGIKVYSTKSPFVFKVNYWTFEFFSVDKENKGLGARRDRLFVNEGNRISWRIIRQLIGRTHVERIVDFNPVKKFWAHTMFVEVGRCDFLKLTYKDNEMLPESEIEDIEVHAPWGALPDENFWRVYGLGEIGYVEGQILTYEVYSELPEGDYQESIGVDFGGTDPMAAVKVYVDHKNKRLYWREIFYASNADIDDVAKSITESGLYNDDHLLCDHNPTQFIMRLRSLGFGALAANKKNGIKADIMLIKQYKIFIHHDSTNLIAEADEWKYQVKNIGGNEIVVDFPDQTCEDHALDAAKYGTTFLIRE